MTKDLLGLMDALGINKAHLVGHSTGGAIGQTMAIEHSDRIDRLVLYATWTKCDPYMRRIFEIRKTLLLDSGVEAYIKATPIFLYPDWWINQNADAFEKADRDLISGFPSAQIAASRCDAVMNFGSGESVLRNPSMPACPLCRGRLLDVRRIFPANWRNNPRRRRVQRDGVGDLRLVVLRIFRRKLLHGRRRNNLARWPWFELVVIDIHQGQRVDIVSLALGLGADRLGCWMAASPAGGWQPKCAGGGC